LIDGSDDETVVVQVVGPRGVRRPEDPAMNKERQVEVWASSEKGGRMAPIATYAVCAMSGEAVIVSARTVAVIVDISNIIFSPIGDRFVVTQVHVPRMTDAPGEVNQFSQRL
jgi:hypothetical protein